MSAYVAYGNTPAAHAPEADRSAFLKEVGIKTLASLAITAVAAVGMIALIMVGPAFLTHRWVSLGIMLGGIYGAQFVGNSLTASPDPSKQTLGFVGGSVLSGVAISYILLSAAVLSSSVLGNPMTLIGQAGGIVFLTLLGMVAYLMSGPKELNWLAAGLSVMFLPMLGLMAITWIFPIGGGMGLAISAVFVAVSAGGLLYSLNGVMHSMSTSQSTAAAFAISSGLVILFWNVIALLMRLTSRD